MHCNGLQCLWARQARPAGSQISVSTGCPHSLAATRTQAVGRGINCTAWIQVGWVRTGLAGLASLEGLAATQKNCLPPLFALKPLLFLPFQNCSTVLKYCVYRVWNQPQPTETPTWLFFSASDVGVQTAWHITDMLVSRDPGILPTCWCPDSLAYYWHVDVQTAWHITDMLVSRQPGILLTCWCPDSLVYYWHVGVQTAWHITDMLVSRKPGIFWCPDTLAKLLTCWFPDTLAY